eukprot:767922-Hanusia_phi.AAC.6
MPEADSPFRTDGVEQGAGCDGPWTSQNPPVCTRHHSIDWNFVGKMRPRPNKCSDLPCVVLCDRGVGGGLK